MGGTGSKLKPNALSLEEIESQKEIMVNAMDQFVRIECELVEGNRVSFHEFAGAFFHHFRVIGVKCEKCSVKSCDNLLAETKFYSFGRGAHGIVKDIYLILDMYLNKNKAIKAVGFAQTVGDYTDTGCLFVAGIRIKGFEKGAFISDAETCECPFGVNRFRNLDGGEWKSKAV